MKLGSRRGTALAPADATLGARPAFVRPRVGDWIVQGATSVTNRTQNNGELRSGPLYLPEGTWDALLFRVGTAGSVGALAKAVLYGDNNGRPGSLVLDTSTVDVTTTGNKTITGLNLIVPAGGALFWAGVVTQGGPSSLPAYISCTATALPLMFDAALSPAVDSSEVQVYSTTGLTGAAPAAAGSGLYGQCARFAFRRAA